MGVIYDRETGEKNTECDNKECSLPIRGNVTMHRGNTYHPGCVPVG